MTMLTYTLPPRAKEIVQCMEEGMNIEETADALGVTPGNISKIALKYNIKIKGQKGRYEKTS